MGDRRGDASHARRPAGRSTPPRAARNGHLVRPHPSVAHDEAKVVPLVTGPSPGAIVTAALETNRCAKCRSTFVMREPAFLHCHYCGAMTRIPAGSLLEQELFELRSGLRLAS